MIETIEIHGRDYTVTTERDTDTGAPWVENDGHGPVSEWTTRNKRAGEMVLCRDRQSCRFYDYQEAVKIAKRDVWGLPEYAIKENNGVPFTPAQIAGLAALHDYEYLRKWCADEWCYIGVIATAPDGETASLWGIESNDDAYIDEVAKELAIQLNSEYQDRQTEEATQ